MTRSAHTSITSNIIYMTITEHIKQPEEAKANRCFQRQCICIRIKKPFWLKDESYYPDQTFCPLDHDSGYSVEWSHCLRPHF